MSDIDLTEAVEEAARVRYERVRRDRSDSTPPWHEASPIHQHAWREGVLAEVTAAAPLIERQVREQIARDIEAAEQQMKASTIDRPKVGPGEFLNDWQWAARIARGGAS